MIDTLKHAVCVFVIFILAALCISAVLTLTGCGDSKAARQALDQAQISHVAHVDANVGEIEFWVNWWRVEVQKTEDRLFEKAFESTTNKAALRALIKTHDQRTRAIKRAAEELRKRTLRAQANGKRVAGYIKALQDYFNQDIDHVDVFGQGTDTVLKILERLRQDNE